MQTSLILRGGRVIDPSTNRDATGDLLIREGRFVESLSPDEADHATVIDATGLVVAPGFVDIHVHFREPGQTHKESIASGSRAAAAGGFTSVVCMPNTSPVCDTPGTIQQIRAAADRSGLIRVHATGCLTRGMDGVEMAPIGSLKKAGVVAVTDDGRCVQNNEIMRQVLTYARMFDLPVMDHCQDYTLTDGAVMNEGDWSLRLGLKGWPREAEDIIVARNIILAECTGAHIHLQHLSSAASVQMVREAKARKIRITAEASPHHISLLDESVRDYESLFKMNPPLRTESDRRALIEGLRDGTIDCIATDHAPHAPFEKDVEFDKAPFGVIGLETSLGVSASVLLHEEGFPLARLVELLSTAGARICGLEAGSLAPGQPADVTLFDPEATWTVDPDRFESKSRNCPWNGKTLRGKVTTTIVGGAIVYDGGKVVSGG